LARQRPQFHAHIGRTGTNSMGYSGMTPGSNPCRSPPEGLLRNSSSMTIQFAGTAPGS
jgi:hypothetical protein